MIRATLILIAAAVALIAGCSKSDAPATHSTEPQAGPQGETMLSAVALSRDYATDPAGYDQKYSGRLVIIEGVVRFDNLKDNLTGFDYLPIEGDGTLLIRCMRTGTFAGQVEGVLAGRKVKVRGRANPFQKGRRDVVLTECDLLSK